MEEIQYVNGSWVPPSQAKISVFDLTIFRGFGIFDYFRTYNQKPMALFPHVDRLFRSAKILGITVPKTKGEIVKIVRKGVEKNKHVGELHIRIIVTGGIGPDSVTPGNPSLLVLFQKLTEFPRKYYEEGVKIITERTVRIFPAAKSLNYMVAVVALQRAKKANAVEVLYADDDGIISEGTTSNFFAVMHGSLVTPNTNILEGITKELVLDISKRIRIRVDQRKLNLSEIPTFQEAFLTASNKEIMPVVTIDDKTVGNGSVGPVVRRLREEYEKLKGTIE